MAAAPSIDALPEDPVVWNAGVYARFGGDAIPVSPEPDLLAATVCRNETALFQLAAACANPVPQARVRFAPLRSDEGELAPHLWEARWVDYVETKEAGAQSDILTAAPQRDVPAGRVQPIWLSLAVPADAKPGLYTGRAEVWWSAEARAVFPVEITVLEAALPGPAEDAFYLDLWQHPGAIARYHGVPLWSEPHWTLIEAYTRLLASAGQNPITACIIHDPWASQTYDAHPSMVEWRRRADGRFTFDFTVFDRYVQCCLDAGFTGPINCYSLAMGPGGRRDCPIRYWDEGLARYDALDCTVGDEAWREAWRAFFRQFTPHLEEKGWFGNTCIALDEAPEDKMQAVLDAIPEEYKVALAGNYHRKLDARIHDYCVIYPGAPASVSQRRRAEGKITTFYTCCGPAYPNTFTISPPVESRLLAWNALRKNQDGYLRWAFASWPERPLEDSSWGEWPSGDTFLVYPGPRSSVRFELLKKGIADFAAAKLAFEKSPDDPRIGQAIKQANAQHNGKKFDPAELDAAREAINAVLAGGS